MLNAFFENVHATDNLYFGGVLQATRQPGVLRSGFRRKGVILRIHHAPSRCVSKISSETFWKNPVYLRKSNNLFHRSALFGGDSSNDGRGPLK
ncbi:hypothetical protein F5X98DRAFT_336097 [Xylaria grammica]|nr:hypothetical protein F5X98DRAFT_336097 [Xylaria grammica]